MQKDKLLVTGGAGFIGSHLVQKLAEDHYEVVILDNLSTGKIENLDSGLLSQGRINFVKGDIRDPKIVKECVNKVEGVVHLAAQISVPLSIQNPEFNNEVNIKGTSNLLRASVNAGVNKFVFVSSCAVYGEPLYLPVDELHPTNPISPYAQSKLSAEQECLDLNRRHFLETSVVRFFNVYGPKQALNDYSGVMTKFMDRIRNNLPLTIFGDGSQTRDFVYVKDITNSIVLALENKSANGEIFNIGTGKAVTIEELANTMLSLTEVELDILKAPERQGDIKQSYADITKAKRLIGYNPQFPLREGLKILLRENGLIGNMRPTNQNSL
jgi:UDP-glucose 4-epimerase